MRDGIFILRAKITKIFGLRMKDREINRSKHHNTYIRKSRCRPTFCTRIGARQEITPVGCIFKDTLSPELFQPIHVVTIACLIEFLVNVEKHTIRISNDTMCTIKLYDVMEGKDFPTAGSSLYDIIRENMNSSDKITINMEGVSSLPSIFLNVSIGKFIDEFGFETLKKKISYAKITKLQAERLTDYISRYKR